MVVLSGQNAGVEEDQSHDQPEHPLRFADVTAFSSHGPVPSENVTIVFKF